MTLKSSPPPFSWGGKNARTTKAGQLLQKVNVQGYPVTIYPPPSVSDPQASPYHRITYYLRGRRHTTSSGRTLEEALARVADIVAEIDAGKPTSHSQCLVRDLAEDFYGPSRRRKKPWSPKHAATQNRLKTKYVLPVAGDQPCAQLTREDLQAIVDTAPTQGEGDRLRRSLAAMIRFGHADGYLNVDPDTLLYGVFWQRRGTPRRIAPTTQGADQLFVAPGMIPSADDVARLAVAATKLPRAPWWYELMPMLTAYSGLRIGEMMALTKAKVSTQPKRRITVDVQQVDLGSVRQMTLPKQGKIRTTIFPEHTPATTVYPQGYPLAEMVRKRLDEIRDDDLLFPAPRGSSWVNTNFYRRYFRPAAESAGWPRTGHPGQPDKFSWTWHSLRHVFCTYYLWDLGKSPADVAQAAGHSSVAITLRIYANPAGGALDRLD